MFASLYLNEGFPDSPAVLRLARVLKCDRYLAVGIVVTLADWAMRHGNDDRDLTVAACRDDLSALFDDTIAAGLIEAGVVTVTEGSITVVCDASVRRED